MMNVQSLLDERYPRLSQRNGKSYRTILVFLRLLFKESSLQQFQIDYPHLSGFDFIEQTLRYFDFSLRIQDKERARIPASGRVVIAANHPLGSLDGLALLSLIRQVRPDVKVIANDLLTAVQPLHPVLLPVNNMGGNTGRKQLRAIRDHLEREGALIIFPAGEVSRLSPKGIKDCTWQSGFVKIASGTQSPILPVFLAGRNSIFFYGVSAFAKPLSTLLLVREMFLQRHNIVDIRVGRAIPHNHYSRLEVSPHQLAALFRKHVYRLARDGRPVFQSVETVAHPENRLLLKQEVERSEWLGRTPDGKQIYVATMDQAPCVIREIGRLRELAFRSVGEGSGQPRDIDRFDKHYQHLILWDREHLEIAGAYRLGPARHIVQLHGIEGLYTHTLFDYGNGVDELMEHGLELGRSFVQARYQDRRSLDYLWCGLGAFLNKYSDYHYLFGPASISPLYGQQNTARLVHHYSTHYPADRFEARARVPFEVSHEQLTGFRKEMHGYDQEKQFNCLRHALAESGMSVPTLFKHYAQATDPGGVQFCAFNVDAAFGQCVDALIIADLQQLQQRKRKRWMGGAGYQQAAAPLAAA
tara:strand:+ start:107133 stop:108884 length:1752 start_codon:yes stop_codon:yes gene_type:complete